MGRIDSRSRSIWVAPLDHPQRGQAKVTPSKATSPRGGCGRATGCAGGATPTATIAARFPRLRTTSAGKEVLTAVPGPRLPKLAASILVASSGTATAAAGRPKLASALTDGRITDPHDDRYINVRMLGRV